MCNILTLNVKGSFQTLVIKLYIFVEIQFTVLCIYWSHKVITLNLMYYTFLKAAQRGESNILIKNIIRDVKGEDRFTFP